LYLKNGNAQQGIEIIKSLMSQVPPQEKQALLQRVIEALLRKHSELAFGGKSRFKMVPKSDTQPTDNSPFHMQPRFEGLENFITISALLLSEVQEERGNQIYELWGLNWGRGKSQNSQPTAPQRHSHDSSQIRQVYQNAIQELSKLMPLGSSPEDMQSRQDVLNNPGKAQMALDRIGPIIDAAKKLGFAAGVKKWTDMKAALVNSLNKHNSDPNGTDKYASKYNPKTVRINNKLTTVAERLASDIHALSLPPYRLSVDEIKMQLKDLIKRLKREVLTAN
jgi:hypothetical protein